MTTTQSDKATVTKYPIAPATCVICLRSANGVLDFIDFQMNLDVYGSVNICVDCLAPVADLIGYVKKTEYEQVKEQNNNLVDMNRELVENNERLNSTLDSLLKLRPDVLHSDLSVDEKPSKPAAFDSDQFTIELDL
jgi:hypothetical protein